MLILKRQDRQTFDLLVGEMVISVCVSECKLGYASLIIDAPKSVGIYRRELTDKINRERVKQGQKPLELKQFYDRSKSDALHASS